jgi:nicotinamidase-related amidase
MKSALIVIDVQASFTQRPYFSTDGLAEYLAVQNAVIERAKASASPIVRVMHTSGGDDAADPFSLASGWVRPIDGLADFQANFTVHKTRHSALVGTGLDVWLTQQGIGELIISGIRTEQCCETTARHASDLGWKVVYAPDATMTWPMSLPSGQSISAQELRDRTVCVLKDRFARIAALDDAF